MVDCDPRRVVSNVLVVTALELRDPIAILVHVKAGDSTRNSQCVTCKDAVRC